MIKKTVVDTTATLEEDMGFEYRSVETEEVKGREVECLGVMYKSYAAMCRHFGLKADFVRRKVAGGYELDIVLKGTGLLESTGNADLADKNGIPYEEFVARRKLGWDVDAASILPLGLENKLCISYSHVGFDDRACFAYVPDGETKAGIVDLDELLAIAKEIGYKPPVKGAVKE